MPGTIDETVTLPAHLLYRLLVEAFEPAPDLDTINDTCWYLAQGSPAWHARLLSNDPRRCGHDAAS